jgi:hypothetical protein
MGTGADVHDARFADGLGEGGDGGHLPRVPAHAEIGEALVRLDHDELPVLPETLAAEVPARKVLGKREG